MRLDAKAELEPLAVAPLLQRLNPEFGWGGDLRLRGQRGPGRRVRLA